MTFIVLYQKQIVILWHSYITGDVAVKFSNVVQLLNVLFYLTSGCHVSGCRSLHLYCH